MRARVHSYTSIFPPTKGADITADCLELVSHASLQYVGENEGIDPTRISCPKCRKIEAKASTEKRYLALITSGEEAKQAGGE